MLIVFVGEGLALLGLMKFGHNPYAFMTFAALVFLCWGEIFSIFPALCADTFGVKNAAGECGHAVHGEGHGRAARAAGVDAVGGWQLGPRLHPHGGDHDRAGHRAKLVLAPMRRRTIERANADPSVVV